jgi:site-specific recombinase XerC
MVYFLERSGDLPSSARCRFQLFEPLLCHAYIATTTIYTRVSADDLARMMGPAIFVSENGSDKTLTEDPRI